MEAVGNILANVFANAGFLQTAHLAGVARVALANACALAKDPESYKRKYIPKKRGGLRPIDVPHPDLDDVQKFINRNFLSRHHNPSTICHAFVPKPIVPEGADKRFFWGRTPISAAFAHLGVPVEREPDPFDNSIPWRHPCRIFAIDMENAYPSVTGDQILAIFEKLTGNPWVAKVLADLSTHNNCLPQGAATSNILFNLRCSELDEDLIGEIENNSSGALKVTRYVDDITVTSIEREIPEDIKRKLIQLVEKHKFKVNMLPEKICDWNESAHVLRINGINLDWRQRRVYLPREADERLRFLMYHSLRVLKEANERWNGEMAEAEQIRSFINCLTKKELKAFGRLGGAVAWASMVYGKDAVPRRYFSFRKELRWWDRSAFELLLSQIKAGRIVPDPRVISRGESP